MKYDIKYVKFINAIILPVLNLSDESLTVGEGKLKDGTITYDDQKQIFEIEIKGSDWIGIVHASNTRGAVGKRVHGPEEKTKQKTN